MSKENRTGQKKTQQDKTSFVHKCNSCGLLILSFVLLCNLPGNSACRFVPDGDLGGVAVLAVTCCVTEPDATSTGAKICNIVQPHSMMSLKIKKIP